MQGARLDTLTSWDPRDVELALFGKINFMRLKPQRFIRTVNRKVKVRTMPKRSLRDAALTRDAHGVRHVCTR